MVGVGYNKYKTNSELNIYSNIEYEMESKIISEEKVYAPDIEPDDINLTDTVAFVWEIK